MDFRAMGLDVSRVGQGAGLGPAEESEEAVALAGDEVEPAVRVPVANCDC